MGTGGSWPLGWRCTDVCPFRLAADGSAMMNYYYVIRYVCKYRLFFWLVGHRVHAAGAALGPYFVLYWFILKTLTYCTRNPLDVFLVLGLFSAKPFMEIIIPFRCVAFPCQAPNNFACSFKQTQWVRLVTEHYS